MYDFKTFAQMNLDLLFKGFQRMPSPGEEVFADTFQLQLGGGPQVCSLVLDKLGCRTVGGAYRCLYLKSEKSEVKLWLL